MIKRSPEHNLQKQIAALLRWNGIITIETDVMSGLQFLPRDVAKRYQFVAYHKAMGYTAGQPDLVLLLTGGETIFVELKAEKGKQSFEQKAFQQSAERLGHNYLVWNSLQNGLDFIKGYKNILAKGVFDGAITSDDYDRAFGIERATASANKAHKRQAGNKQQLEVAGEN